MRDISLEIKYKNKLFYYMQIVKLIIASGICLTSTFIIPTNIYNFYIPFISGSVAINSIIGLILYHKFDSSLRYTTYISTGLDFFIILVSIYVSSFAYTTMFFWVPAFILFTYFFTNIKFTLIQLFISFAFLAGWPWAYINKEDILMSTVAADYGPTFYLSTSSFILFIFTIFHFSEKIKNMYAQAVIDASGQIRAESSFPMNNPNPVFEYNKVEHLVPRNHHAREFILTATNIEIDRLMQYSLDSMNSKNEKKVRCMLGKDHYIVNLVPIENKINIYMTNITDLIRAQIEIQEKEQYNRAVIDAMPGFVSWVDNDMKYLGVNKHMCDFFNTKEEEFVGNKVGAIHSYSDTSILNITKKLFANSSVDTISNEIKYEYNGEIFWNYITLKKYDHGQKAVLVSVDLTNLKKAEEQITEEQKKAEANAKLAAFGEMSAGIAHEINNPLSIIKGTVQRINKLRSKGTLTEEKFDGLLEKTHYGIDRVTKIISGMKNLSRDGQNDAFEMSFMKEIIDDSLVLLSKKCEACNIELIISNYDKNIEFFCQRVQISQVLVILINNSIDAIQNNQHKWIKIFIEKADNKLKISIVDSGSGVGISVTKKIFKPFFTTKKVGKGTGLGLSLAERIIKAHKGEFTLDQESKNTKFDITIPLDLEMITKP